MDTKGAVVLTNLFVDEHYVPTLGMKMVQGRNFSHDFPSDSTGIILNESAVQLLGWKDPINQLFYRPGRQHEKRCLPCDRRGKGF